MELVYQNEIGTSYYDPDLKIIVYKSNKLFVNFKTDLIKDLLGHTADFLHEKYVAGEIVDISDMRGNFRKVIAYLVDEYYPEMYQNGMGKCAYVIPNDIIIDKLVDVLIDKNKTKTRSFHQYEKAKAWVSSTHVGD